jgi:hypothetical protein
MTTLSQINKAISNLGDIELVKGNGYFYFVGLSVCVHALGVYVYSVKDLTLQQWVEEAKAIQVQ